MNSELRLLDFHHPRQPTKPRGRTLFGCLNRFCTVWGEAWNSFLVKPFTLTAAKMEPYRYRTLLDRFPDDGFGIHVTIGPEQFSSLIVLPREVLHGVVATILGMSDGEGWPAVRPFTRAEDAMLQVLYQEVAKAMSESFPGAEATECKLVSTMEKPERNRLFVHVEEVFVGAVNIDSSFGQAQALWILPRVGTEHLLGEDIEDVREERPVADNLIQLAHKIPVDICVELGRCHLSMNEAAQLTPGDVLVLNQRIHQPLTAFVEGTPKWSGIPLRMGNRQAFEIRQIISR